MGVGLSSEGEGCSVQCGWMSEVGGVLCVR